MTHFVRTHKTLPPCYEGRESFKCEIESCGYIFLRKYRLDEHMKAVHGDKNKTNPSRKIRNNKTYASKPGSIHCPECNKPMSSDHKLRWVKEFVTSGIKVNFFLQKQNDWASRKYQYFVIWHSEGPTKIGQCVLPNFKLNSKS